MRKYARYAGADNKTPSVPQYFSWINNTNEGSTERQTLINLDFFRWMKETYGMQIRIYAWDAGNFDGASQGYGDLKGAKFQAQYPEEYNNVVKAAEAIGIRMGLWGSPDGFGDDPQTEKERFDFFVHLCRDHHFAQFKLDGVCGQLRPEKAALFAEMLRECRKYSPDLIVLNHRLNLYEAEPYVTTFLWNGEETYTDVFTHNKITAMHNRAYLFTRGHVKGLSRLAEDHGVCLSSSLDYFEDDLLYQAFSRCLILAPEMYGNPWFLRDNEFPKLARVYNYHRQNAPLLVNGQLLPESFGPNAVSRGNGDKRLICTGNDTWEPRTVTIPLDDAVGLGEGPVFEVNLRHPYEAHLGVFRRGESVEIPLPPFRAVLIEIAVPALAEPVLTNCRYEMIKEDANGAPVEVRLLQSDGGPVALRVHGEERPFMTAAPTDEMERPPLLLGSLDALREWPEDGERLYEAAVFAADNDCLEARCIKRSGPTAVPEVAAAREAFFGQKTYRLRGCEAKNMFDGDPDTFFDGQSRTYCGGFRIDGGCLRVDFGETLSADALEIDFFATDAPTREVRSQTVPTAAEISRDLRSWQAAPLDELRTADPDVTAEIVKFGVHTTYPLHGSLRTARYALPGALRYLRIAEPMDRIHAVRLLRGGEPLPLRPLNANNLQAHYVRRPCRVERSGSVTLPAYGPGDYLAVAVNCDHGAEGVYCCMEVAGELYGAPRRAPDYKANVWEHIVCNEPLNNTFFFPLPAGWQGKTASFHAVFSNDSGKEADCKVWLCVAHR